MHRSMTVVTSVIKGADKVSYLRVPRCNLDFEFGREQYGGLTDCSLLAQLLRRLGLVSKFFY